MGLSELVDLFMKDTSGYLYFQNATWDDAPHLTEAIKKELLKSIPDYQKEMRSRGLPVLGEGLIYSVSESSIACEPFEIPSHWRRVCGIDVGIAHDTAAVWTAYDAATDTMYIYDCYSASGDIPAVHATAINARGKWIPVILPHDSGNTEKGTGKSMIEFYIEAGINVQHDTFYNTMSINGVKNNHVEPGLMNILQRMKTGRFKVFKTCGKVFEEMRRYHRKDGKIIKKFDDTMDAMRYSSLSVINRGISEGEGKSGFNSAYKDMWDKDNFNVNY